MHLLYHGGYCCGIKIIQAFPYGPTEMVPALRETSMTNLDQSGSPTDPQKPFFHESAPREPAIDRVKRYIDYLKRRRPKGMVEVTLFTTTSGTYGQQDWFPVLEELGFKDVTQFKNSNSGNIVHVFHLVYGQ